uniref:Uncharacterized protein n=1 Tax=Romanomermis culicivorax TaxID=13658 RepID=A0A915KX10_ROMCU
MLKSDAISLDLKPCAGYVLVFVFVKLTKFLANFLDFCFKKPPKILKLHKYGWKGQRVDAWGKVSSSGTLHPMWGMLEMEALNNAVFCMSLESHRAPLSDRGQTTSRVP